MNESAAQEDTSKAPFVQAREQGRREGTGSTLP